MPEAPKMGDPLADETVVIVEPGVPPGHVLKTIEILHEQPRNPS